MRELVVSTAKSLDRARMIRFVEHTGNLHATDLGRTASHFYIKSASIEVSISPALLSFFFSLPPPPLPPPPPPPPSSSSSSSSSPSSSSSSSSSFLLLFLLLLLPLSVEYSLQIHTALYDCGFEAILIILVQKFNELLKPHMNDGEILAMVSKSEEFDQVKVWYMYIILRLVTLFIRGKTPFALHKL